jgi:hypothetical protein
MLFLSVHVAADGRKGVQLLRDNSLSQKQPPPSVVDAMAIQRMQEYDLQDPSVRVTAEAKMKEDGLPLVGENDLEKVNWPQSNLPASSNFSRIMTFVKSQGYLVKERIENITLRDAALNDEIDKEIEQFRALEPSTVKRKVLAVFLKISYSLKREVASQYRDTEHLREFIKRANMTLDKAGGRFCDLEETESALGLLEKSSELPSIDFLIKDSESRIAKVMVPRDAQAEHEGGDTHEHATLGLHDAHTHPGEARKARHPEAPFPLHPVQPRPVTKPCLTWPMEFHVAVFNLAEVDDMESKAFEKIKAFIMEIKKLYSIDTTLDVLKTADAQSKAVEHAEVKRTEQLRKRKAELGQAVKAARRKEALETIREFTYSKLPPDPDTCSIKCRLQLRRRIAIFTEQVNVLTKGKPEKLHGIQVRACAEIHTPGACLQDFACGWCNRTSTCLDGTSTGPIFQKEACPRDNWLHGDDVDNAEVVHILATTSLEHATGGAGMTGASGMTGADNRDRPTNDLDDLPSMRGDHARDMGHSWDEARNGESLHFGPPESKNNRNWNRVGMLSDQTDVTIATEGDRSGMETPNELVPNKNTPSGDPLDDSIPRYIGNDDLVAHHHYMNQTWVVKHRYNTLTEACAGFVGTPLECEEAMRIAKSRGIALKAMYDPYHRGEHPGGDAGTTGHQRYRNELTKFEDRLGQYKKGGIAYSTSHNFPNEQEDAEGLIRLNAGEELPLPSGRGGGGGQSAEDIVLNIGSPVDARWQGGCLYEKANIVAINADGLYELRYVDGKKEEEVSALMLKPRGVVFADMCKGVGCVNIWGGGCPDVPRPLPGSRASPGYDCANVNYTCEVTKDCCTDLVCDGSKHCVDVADEVKQFGLDGVSTPTAVNDTGDVDYGVGGKVESNPVNILKNARKSEGLPPNVLDAMEPEEPKEDVPPPSKKEAAAIADAEGAAASKMGGKAAKNLNAQLDRQKAAEQDPIGQKLYNKRIFDPALGDNSGNQKQFSGSPDSDYMQKMGKIVATAVDPTLKENLPLLPPVGLPRFKTGERATDATPRFRSMHRWVMAKDWPPKEKEDPPENKLSAAKGDGSQTLKEDEGSPQIKTSIGKVGGRKNKKGGKDSKGGKDRPKPPSAPSKVKGCHGLIHMFCNLVPKCCWEMPPQHPDKDKQPGECKFTADGRCDSWAKALGNKNPYFGLSHPFQGGKPVGNSPDAIQRENELQKMKADISTNALKAITPGGKAKYIDTGEEKLNSLKDHSGSQGASKGVSSGAQGDSNKNELTHKNELTPASAANAGNSLEVIHTVHFDDTPAPNAPMHPLHTYSQTIEKWNCTVPSPPIRCTHNSQCPGATTCREAQDPRTFPYPNRKSEPFVPYMSCECGAEPGGKCAKSDECKYGNRCVKAYGICLVPRKLGEQCGSHVECDDGMACAPSGECIDYGGIGSSCTKATERTDCADGLTCSPAGVCKGASGSPCESTADCIHDHVCSNGLRQPSVIMQAQEAMESRSPTPITIDSKMAPTMIDPVQGIFFHDTKDAGVQQELNFLQTQTQYYGTVQMMYDWAYKPRNKLAACSKAPVEAIRTWRIPREIVSMIRFFTNAEIPLITRMDGSCVLDPRASFQRIQGACTVLNRAMSHGMNESFSNEMLHRDPRKERVTRMEMMRDLAKQFNKYKTQQEGMPNRRPRMENLEKDDVLPSEFYVCVWDNYRGPEWEYKKQRKIHDCCSCTASSFIDVMGKRHPRDSNVPPDVRAALFSGVSTRKLAYTRKPGSPPPSRSVDASEHLLRQYGDKMLAKVSTLREQAMASEADREKLISVLLEMQSKSTEWPRSNVVTLKPEHPYLGYAIQSRPQECCACPDIVNKLKASDEKGRENSQLDDINGWAKKYNRSSFLLPKTKKDAAGLENPCNSQLSLACFRHNDRVKRSKLDNLEQWGDDHENNGGFGGQPVWRAPKVSSVKTVLDQMLANRSNWRKNFTNERAVEEEQERQKKKIEQEEDAGSGSDEKQ